MGEHLRAPRAGLGAAGGAPGSLLPAARAGTRSDRGARSPASPALPPCPRGPAALPSAGTAHSAPGAHAVPALAPEPARAGPGTRGCVCVCLGGGNTAGCVTSRGCPLRHPALGTGTAAAEPSSLPGLAPGLPDPSWAGPGLEAPGGHCSAAPFFCFSCFSGEVVLSVWGSRVDRFELQRSRRELCSPPGRGWGVGGAGGGGPWDRGRSIARPGSSVVLPWKARDPGDCSRARPRSRGAGLGRAGRVLAPRLFVVCGGE